ncbi:glycosyltransferase [Amnibacterium kyonggiense]
MRITMITKIPVFPTTGGNRARQLTLLEEFARAGHELSFLLLPSYERLENDATAHVDFFGPDRYRLVDRHRLVRTPFLLRTLMGREVRNLRHRLGQPARLHRDVDYRLDPALRKPVRTALAQLRSDAVIVSYVHYSALLEEAPPGALRILDTHDSFSHEFTPDAERKGLSRADRVIAIQEEEAAFFAGLLGSPATVHLVSHIPAEIARPTAEDVGVDPLRSATFVGSAFDANIASLNWFIAEVLPRLLRFRPDFVLQVVGSIGPRVSDHPAVKKLGIVDDLGEVYRCAPVVINPIVVGTGVKIKLLEAVAAGLPVVSTSRGAVGLPAYLLEGVAITPDGDADAFAVALRDLLSSPRARRRAHEASLRAAEVWTAKQRRALNGMIGRVDS